VSTDVAVRRIAQVIVLLCVAGSAYFAVGRDWQDALLVGVLGALALVTARKMAWRVRQDRDGSSTGPVAHGWQPPLEM
jgi:glucose-6-phosphate-specific signal transduction histidine kinase